jgi:hypothetical protein
LAKEATYGNMINLPPRCHLPMRSNNHDYGWLLSGGSGRNNYSLMGLETN